jgi:Tfp pilus assembly pilus retraction ATPase PilT
MNKIDNYLQAALGQKASDLHFISGDPVRARVHGGGSYDRDHGWHNAKNI